MDNVERLMEFGLTRHEASLYILLTLEAVSYTHLDVYKRQEPRKSDWMYQNTERMLTQVLMV